MLSKITDVASTTPAKSSPLKPLLPALSSWLPSLRLGQRLSLWYATPFTGSVAVLFAVAYLLMARALAAKDAEILESKLKEYGTLYQAGGLGVLRASVDRERGNAGGTPLLIRLLGRGNVVTFASVPEGWIQLAGYERDWMGVARPVEVVDSQRRGTRVDPRFSSSTRWHPPPNWTNYQQPRDGPWPLS